MLLDDAVPLVVTDGVPALFSTSVKLLTAFFCGLRLSRSVFRGDSRVSVEASCSYVRGGLLGPTSATRAGLLGPTSGTIDHHNHIQHVLRVLIVL